MCLYIRRIGKCRRTHILVHCQRPKSKRTRKSVLRIKKLRQEQDKNLLDYANKLQKELNKSLNGVLYANSKCRSSRQNKSKSKG